MAVKVSKPAINIREKLSELQKPSGITGEALLRADTVQDVRDSINAGRKNLLINGDMQVSQRIGTTAATITDGSYGLDRWNAYASGPVKTTQQVTESPAGLAHSMKFVNTSASASPSYNFFRYCCY